MKWNNYLLIFYNYKIKTMKIKINWLVIALMISLVGILGIPVLTNAACGDGVWDPYENCEVGCTSAGMSLTLGGVTKTCGCVHGSSACDSTTCKCVGFWVPATPNGIPDKPLDEVIMDITDWVLGFAGIIAILVIVYGGLLYLTSAGNEDQMEKGKKTLMWGILGLVIIGISYAIVKVIVDVWLKA